MVIPSWEFPIYLYPMEHEMTFPNPIDRLDLPVKRRRWPKVLAVVLVLAALPVIFLPQLLRTAIVRGLFVSWLEHRTNTKVWLDDIQTSWFGNTTFTKIWLQDADGTPHLGANSLKTEMSLKDLISGNYKLGNVDADGLLIDYVVDYGDGRDLIDKLNTATNWSGIPIGRRPVQSWRVSGNITVHNGTLSLTRGELDQKFRKTYHTARFADVTGKIDIPSFTQQWAFDVTATCPGQTKADPNGTAAFSGHVNLGPAAKFVAAGTSADLKVQMRNVHTTPLGWVLCSMLKRDDYYQMFGRTIQSVNAAAHLADGKLQFDVLKVVGQPYNGHRTYLEAQPVVDISGAQTVITQGSTPIVASVRLSPGLGRNFLCYADPFLADSTDGLVDISIDRLNLPVGHLIPGTSVTATLAIANGKLWGAHDWNLNEPVSATGQWQAITGNAASEPEFTLPKVEFTVMDDEVKLDSHPINIEGSSVVVDGTIKLDGSMKLIAYIPLPPEVSKDLQSLTGPLPTTIGGTMEHPLLDGRAAAHTLTAPDDITLLDKINTHIEEQRNRNMQQMAREKTAQLEAGLRHVKKLIGADDPTTRP